MNNYEPTASGYLATILRNSAHGLLAIIDDILDFSKAEAGKLALIVDDVEPYLLV